ncbi:hypothetical protein DFS33DRAFT_1489024 [Desarmillaria ectypa]|nr:hypothetical protein DFS33DRAFT_1489024 [Desarmillaria ectypa]
MADREGSPISQLLNTLGITREELHKRSDQMRQFLTADSAYSSRVSDRDSSSKSSSASLLRSTSLSTTSASTSARSFSRASSSSMMDASPPPSTPIKSEPVDGPLPQRHHDTMEEVIERQRLARKERRDKKGRRDKERDFKTPRSHPRSPSPSASQSSTSLGSSIGSRDERVDGSVRSSSSVAESREEGRPSPPPLTPQQSKYYRAHTASQSYSSLVKVNPKQESPTPTRPQSVPVSQSGLHYCYAPYPLPVLYTSTPVGNDAPADAELATPTPTRIIKAPASKPSPLPPSSPPPSSPVSSPNKPIVNLVSSPGPMGPLPIEDEYDGLPYSLPPGPYSPNKPDCSYAALLGQAILSSPEHRLTLQEIYDWITIVYPYFKRGETTWMNSIRHVLSTTVCFRKVTRDRSLGRTLWAIWDEDLECFKGGGFRKQLCSDIKGKEKPNTNGGTKRSRKPSEGDGAPRNKKAKKEKEKEKEKAAPAPILSAPLLPLFPPSRPTPHHQPYYESCIPKTLPSEIIFPPLPSTSGYRQLADSKAAAVQTSSAVTPSSEPPQTGGDNGNLDSPHGEDKLTPPHPTSSSASASSVPSSLPELTPNDSSSSPPVSSSDMEVDVGANLSTAPISISGVDTDEDDEDVEQDVFTMQLKPVRFWCDSDKQGGTLQPGIQLKYNVPDPVLATDDEDDEPAVKATRGKKKNRTTDVPASPTLGLRSNPLKTTKAVKNKSRLASPPPTTESPSTPTRKSTFGPSFLSPIHTPLSHRGLHMSPSASLAHYKSNLDPPPFVSYPEKTGDNEEADEDGDNDLMRTPSKTRSAATSSALPVTPRRLFSLGDSPFRTPVGKSSFRSIYDPHDPTSLLDDELHRMGAAGHGDSPAGLFGKSRASLLYDSPGNVMGGSPDKWQRWW